MDNRSNILSCALTLFSARGYDAVGVQEIVEAAGITKPTLYHYFGSKQGLLRALLDAYQAPFTQAITAAAAYDGDLPRTLERLARAYFEYARQHPVFYRMQLAMVFAPHDSEAYPLAANHNEQQYRLVESMFASAVHDHGNMRGRHKLYAAAFIGLLNTCITLWLNHAAELDDALLYRVVHQYEHGIYS